jgi:hypothetical protein
VNFYTQVLLEIMLALGAAMVVGNIMAIVRRERDRDVARTALKKSARSSRHQNAALARNQVKEGKATLAVAPLGRSLIFVLIGAIVALWSLISLIR